MAWVLQCDRCHKTFQHKEGYRKIFLKYFKSDEEYKNKGKGLDLCPECMSQLINFLEVL